MLELSPSVHSRLTDRLIGILKSQGISTVSDFLRTDSNKLKQYINIDLMELTSIKTEFWKMIGIVPINGLDHYIELTTQSICIPTGINSLDEMLNGGLLPGNIVDVCGFSAVGKTQLHTTIAINWSINQDYETFVIDTKGDFSGDRIHRILLSQNGFDADKRKHIMRNIKVEQCNSASDLIELITKLIDQKASFPKCKLLVIDSLPALFFHYHGKKHILGYQKLVQFADRLRNLAVEHGIVVMTVNIETRSMVSGDENAIDDVERSEHDVTDRTLSPSMSEIAVPALGKHWKTICPLRLQIQKRYDDATNPNAHHSGSAIIKCTNERTIRILKSNQYPVDASCVVQITNSGII